jgi:hypothetical protein
MSFFFSLIMISSFLIFCFSLLTHTKSHI